MALNTENALTTAIKIRNEIAAEIVSLKIFIKNEAAELAEKLEEQNTEMENEKGTLDPITPFTRTVADVRWHLSKMAEPLVRLQMLAKQFDSWFEEDQEK